MKKALLLIAALAAFAACTRTVEVPVEVEVEVEKIVDLLTLNATSIQAPQAGVVQPMNFTTEDSWDISSDADWITFDKASGKAGSNTVNMTVAKNEGFDSRTGRVTLSTTHGTTTKNTVFTVVQSQVEVFNTTVALGIDYAEQDITVDFNSNFTPEVAIVDGDWLTITRTKAAPVDGKIVLHAAENADLDARVGVFTVFAGNSLQTYRVVQASQYASATSATAEFLGNKQDMYNNAVGWTEFAQYGIRFETQEGIVTLALNVDPAIEDITKVPAGTYTMDEQGTYAPNTFSVQSTDLNEKYYTTVNIVGKDMEIMGGTVTVAEEGGIYSIAAEFTDILGSTHFYKYNGELVATDASFGMRVYEAKTRGQYYTYFTTKAYETVLGVQFSTPAPGVDRYLSYMSFSLYSAESDGYLPTGTFTYAVPENDPDLHYNNGILNAAAGTFQMTGCENRMENWGDATYTVKEGANTLEISKQDDGLYTFKFNMTIVRTPAEGSPEDIPFVATVTDVPCGALGDMGVVVAPDIENPVIVNGGFNSMFAGQYFGDKFGDGGHLITAGWTMANDGTYYMNFLINLGSEALTPTAGTISANYRDELGTTPRYWRGTMPDGTYTYSDTYDKDAKQLLHGYFSDAARGYVTNSYTGTVFHINGGSITFSGGTPTFDFQAVSSTGMVAHFKGTLTVSGSQLDFNYQHSTFRNRLRVEPYVVPAP